ncbi:inner membrane transporter yfaV [Apodospora peruviana]|uniref:Inner membrane transporter yfaV n=1 Tax=Apodospora peruviana TaxID=516989 RepID=A0AAE0M407_9PEZI|nr:inner membrane transporter yfaV [Apodospora peruviana]
MEQQRPKDQSIFMDTTDGEISIKESPSPEKTDDRDERKVRRKIDSSVLPLLFLGMLVFQLDRMNIASALTGGFAADIGVNLNTINLGNQLMFMSIVLVEIPSNIVLQKVGPRKWIACQVLAFGLVASLQIFVNGRTGFLVSRLVLGFCESGYIPAAIYTLSTWYTKREHAKRVAILFFGMFGANAISPLLATGILKLDHVRGLHGWQWLFLIEGLFTVVVSFVLIMFLPGSPSSPRPLLTPGIIKFSAQDVDILRQRIENDNPEETAHAQGMHIPLKLVWQTVSHYRRWPHFISTFAVFSTWGPLTTYTPSVMVSLGWDPTAANALAAVGAVLSLFFVFLVAYVSDKTNQRGATVIVSQICFLVALVVAREIHPHVGRWSRWGLWTAVNALAVGYHPAHNTWVQLNCRDPRERSISIAMFVMAAISGLMVGTQYYQADDKPFYQNGLRIQIIMVSVGITFSVIQWGIYVVHNKHATAETHQPGVKGQSPQIYVS